jgi:hypothetical protein
VGEHLGCSPCGIGTLRREGARWAGTEVLLSLLRCYMDYTQEA